jgi:hypothetical protein
MDDKCRKVVSTVVPCLFGQSLSGEGSVPASCAPVKGKASEAATARLVFGSHAGGAIVDSSPHPGGLDFGIAGGHAGYGPRFDIPGPMMRTVRDPALSLSALSGVDPEGPVMVEIPPVADAGHLRNTPSLAGSRIGFAREYVSGDVREALVHSAHFAHVLDVLRAAGAQLVPVHAHLADDRRYFTLDPGNEINDRITESRLDVLVSDSQSSAFHRTATAGNPRMCVLTGTNADGAWTSIWFYGAHWARDQVAALAQGCQQALSQSTRPTTGSE